MYEVEYNVYNTVKTKKFDTYKAARGFFNMIYRKNYCRRAELKSL